MMLELITEARSQTQSFWQRGGGRVLSPVSESCCRTCGSQSSRFANPSSPSHQAYGVLRSAAPIQEMLVVAMAPAPLTTFVSSPARHPCSYSYHRRRRGAVSASSSSSSSTKAEDVVIVGAGIAGLATALSLRRLGVGATVLEQGPSLRAGGTSLTLFKNGWRVLDSIGVADELRAKYLRVQGYTYLALLLSPSFMRPVLVFP